VARSTRFVTFSCPGQPVDCSSNDNFTKRRRKYSIVSLRTAGYVFIFRSDYFHCYTDTETEDKRLPSNTNRAARSETKQNRDFTYSSG